MSLVVKALTKAIAPLAGGVTKELSGYLGDQIRFLRWKSAVHILERARSFCDEKKLAPDKIPIKFLVPFLEGASFENVETEPSLADMWSSLLGAAVTNYQARFAVYVDILKKLSTREANFLRKFHAVLIEEEIYRDEDSFNPDFWNSNDKQDQVDLFESLMKEHGRQILDVYRNDAYRPNQFDGVMNEIGKHSVRTDLLPIGFDLSFYKSEGWTNGIGGLFDKTKNDIDPILNLVTLGLMERFDAAAWYPRRHQVGRWAVRGTCSFAMLNSLGFDFMKACIREESKPSKRRKTKKRA